MIICKHQEIWLSVNAKKYDKQKIPIILSLSAHCSYSYTSFPTCLTSSGDNLLSLIMASPPLWEGKIQCRKKQAKLSAIMSQLQNTKCVCHVLAWESIKMYTDNTFPSLYLNTTFPLAPMMLLVPESAHSRPTTQPPLGSETDPLCQFLGQESLKWPSFVG
jgi:hypothetical protein